MESNEILPFVQDADEEVGVHVLFTLKTFAINVALIQVLAGKLAKTFAKEILTVSASGVSGEFTTASKSSTDTLNASFKSEIFSPTYYAPWKNVLESVSSVDVCVFATSTFFFQTLLLLAVPAVAVKVNDVLLAIDKIVLVKGEDVSI